MLGYQITILRHLQLYSHESLSFCVATTMITFASRQPLCRTVKLMLASLKHESLWMWAIMWTEQEGTVLVSCVWLLGSECKGISFSQMMEKLCHMRSKLHNIQEWSMTSCYFTIENDGGKFVFFLIHWIQGTTSQGKPDKSEPVYSLIQREAVSSRNLNNSQVLLVYCSQFRLENNVQDFCWKTEHVNVVAT